MIDHKSYELGLIGWPVEHSLSPIIHNAALKASRLEGSYRLYPIPPDANLNSGLSDLFNAVRSFELAGLNITIPHKIATIPLLDSLTQAAAQIGAVNTVFLEDGNLCGDNTDAQGFINDLNTKLPAFEDEKTALVLGAGGSSRAVTYGLAQEGWKVIIAARRLEQAQELASDLDPNMTLSINTASLDRKNLETIHPALIVNTTPVGMAPNTLSSPWPDDLRLPESAAIYDLVYNPNETLLIKTARQAGLKAYNGLGMLVEQAAISFERWTGHPAPRETMHLAVRENITLKQDNHGGIG